MAGLPFAKWIPFFLSQEKLIFCPIFENQHTITDAGAFVRQGTHLLGGDAFYYIPVRYSVIDKNVPAAARSCCWGNISIRLKILRGCKVVQQNRTKWIGLQFAKGVFPAGNFISLIGSYRLLGFANLPYLVDLVRWIESEVLRECNFILKEKWSHRKDQGNGRWKNYYTTSLIISLATSSTEIQRRVYCLLTMRNLACKTCDAIYPPTGSLVATEQRETKHKQRRYVKNG